MTQYVALLRGINVSGKNKITMALLRQKLEENGFDGVKTYINSGNVIFKSNSCDKSELRARIEQIIEEAFNLQIPTVILTEADIMCTLNNAPEWWGTDDKAVYHNTIFLIPPAKVETVYDAVGVINPEYEKVMTFNGVIYWSAVLKFFSKSRWSKIASSSVNHEVTIRTANTVKKIYQMMMDYEETDE